MGALVDFAWLVDAVTYVNKPLPVTGVLLLALLLLEGKWRRRNRQSSNLENTPHLVLRIKMLEGKSCKRELSNSKHSL